MSASNIIALIPARSGSKDLEDKNILDLGGRPLLAWTIQACLKAGLFRRVIVSTDSPEYASLAVEWGAEAPFLRPAEISQDRSTDYEFVAHALTWFKENDQPPLLLAHMRPTTPFRDPNLISSAVERFEQTVGATALRSVDPMPESAYKTFEIGESELLQSVATGSVALDDANEARQEFPTTYRANGYVDVLSVEHIQRQRQIHGDRVVAFVTPPTTEVDSSEEINYLEFQLADDPTIATRVFG